MTKQQTAPPPLTDVLQFAKGTTIVREFARSLIERSHDGKSCWWFGETLVRRDLRSDEVLQEYNIGQQIALRYRFSPDHTRVAQWDFNNLVTVRDLTGKILGTPLQTRGQRGTLTWSNNSAFVVASEAWDSDIEKLPMHVLDRDGASVRQIAIDFQPEEPRVCAAGSSGLVVASNSPMRLARIALDTGTVQTQRFFTHPNAPPAARVDCLNNRIAVMEFSPAMILTEWDSSIADAWPSTQSLAVGERDRLAEVGERIKARAARARANAAKQKFESSMNNLKTIYQSIEQSNASSPWLALAPGTKRFINAVSPEMTGVFGPNYLQFADANTIVASSGAEVVRTLFVDDSVSHQLLAEVNPKRAHEWKVDVAAISGRLALLYVSSPRQRYAVVEFPEPIG